MNEQRLKSLYARLQAQRADIGGNAVAWRIGNELAGDAQRLSDGLARSAAPRRGMRPALGWALAASVALVAVFAGRQLAQDEALPGTATTDPADMIATAPAPEPLFSGSFENGRAGGGESIFDNDFGS